MKEDKPIYRWNNFYMYFPSEGYRKYNNNNNKTKKIISDLDKILEEQNFDIKTFNKIIKKKNEYFNEYLPIIKKEIQQKRQLTQGEAKTLTRLDILEKKNYQLLDSLLEPVINKMLEKGYKLQDLIA
jgi:hypothetical protein